MSDLDELDKKLDEAIERERDKLTEILDKLKIKKENLECEYNDCYR